MKTINTFIAIVLFSLLISSCASSSKKIFETSSYAPAATGSVQSKQDKNKNFIIEVKTASLAEPQRLSPAREAYIVWMESGSSPVRKLGRMTISKKLKGTLVAPATVAPSRVFITAENDASITSPQGDVILTTARQ